MSVGAEGVSFAKVEVPKQRRETRIVRDLPVEELASEIVEWLRS